MAKRQALAYNTQALERNLQQSTGQGVDAFFSHPSPTRAVQAEKPPTATPSQSRRRRPKMAQKETLPAQEAERPLADESTGKIEEPKRTTAAPVGSRYHESMTPRLHGPALATTVERVRKAVKRVGKEAATHRFTVEEKQAIADIVYTYGRRGYRTSENEIARIALNWLVQDDLENGKEGVLEQVLRALME